MATSGTVGATSIDVITLVEHAFRRCAKLPSTVSAEQLLGAKESLFFLLTNQVNQGLSLWCISKYVVPTVPGKTVYPLPRGAEKVLNVSYRTQAALSGTPISGTGWSGAVFTGATFVTNVEIAFTAAVTPALVVETSLDAGATWQQVGAFDRQAIQLPAGEAVAQDLDNPVAATHWRVRDTSGVLGATSVLTFSNTPSEVPMAPFNRDDYFNLPNKTFQATRAVQYWFDKQLAPQLWVWPVPSSGADQIVAQVHRQIQDVGVLTGTLEVPQRWYEYIIFALACKVAVELPAGELPPGRLEYLEAKAAEHLMEASDGESDGAPLRLQPNLRGYT